MGLADPAAKASALSALSIRNYPGQQSAHHRRDLPGDPPRSSGEGDGDDPSEGLIEVSAREDYLSQLDSGETIQTLISEVEGFITFSQIDRSDDMKIVNQFKVAKTSEAGELAQKDLSFQKKLGKDLDVSDVLALLKATP